MSSKPNILVFIDWFWPGYLAGGPVQSIVSLVNYLGNDFNFKIITTNSDLNSEKSYPGIESNKWTKSFMGCDVFYADAKTLNADAIKKIVDGITFEKVYINSFFSKHFSIVPLQILNKYYKNTPVVLAPRGMLGDGALAIKKFKKKLFLIYSKLVGLHSKVIWHATSTQEEQEIKKNFHPKRIVKISNLPKKLSSTYKKTKKPGSLHLCFISRISEKKNLLFALQILEKIEDINIRYNIYGPLEDQLYWEKCEFVIKRMPSNVCVTYKGSIDPTEIETVLADEHMMFLPTLNENFGHSIVESLLCGCPVIISDQTPWNDLEEHGAGYAINLSDKQKFREAIKKSAALNEQEFLSSSKKAISYISDKIDLQSITEHYKTLFNESIKD
ncbi:glycosyl transferase family 1 [Sphingobacteriaceae bacterium]|nr:glycosyl transferase family 1 [Sphingobacteriaceae bacterium]